MDWLRSDSFTRRAAYPYAKLGPNEMVPPRSLISFSQDNGRMMNWTGSSNATVIRCTRSVNPPEAHQRRTAERLHAAWHALETGHYPMLSAPEALTGLLVA